MTRTDDHIPASSTQPDARSLPGAIDVNWSCLLSPSHRHPILGLNGAATSGTRHVTIHARLHLRDPDDARLDVTLKTEGAEAHILVEDAPVQCDHHVDGEWTHLDVAIDGERILAVSLTPDEQPDYVHSSLPARAGFSPGMCEPPTIRVEA